jgi:hypothetical protein
VQVEEKGIFISNPAVMANGWEIVFPEESVFPYWQFLVAARIPPNTCPQEARPHQKRAEILGDK